MRLLIIACAICEQVMNLQAELDIVQTHLSTLQHLPPPNPQNNPPTEADSSSNAQPIASVHISNNKVPSSLLDINCMSQQQQQEPQRDIEDSTEFSTLLGLEDPLDENGDLNALTREFVSKYMTGGKFRPSSPI